jgi:uncharacterized cupin superfamily protein
MSRPVMNLQDLEFTREIRHGEKFAARIAPVGAKLGAKKLGYNVTSVPPGKAAFPYHNHHANEELFFILEGEGTLRFGKQELALRSGDFVCCPPGGVEAAHQIINTGKGELRYIALSTALDTDIFQYPDSGKVGLVGGRPPGQPIQEATFPGKWYVEAAAVDYYLGE